MSTHKNIDRICVAITVITLLITVLFVNGKSLGVSVSSTPKGYESTLFDTTRVHTIDIVADDWDAFLANATSEEYTSCSLIIDNESVKNVAIRGKGNTSLSTVATLNSDRYSFKIEFDHYESGKTYKGLDKLCLNNLIQDNTYMKDYLTYRMMNEFGADAPLCSYVWVTVNGEDWGLYLAVEAVEDSFLSRVYSGEGDLYKPDSMSMGGGPGHGRDFNMSDFMDENADAMGMPWNRGSKDSDSEIPQSSDIGVDALNEADEAPSDMPSGDWTIPSDMPTGDGTLPSDMPTGDWTMPSDMPSGDGTMPSDMPSGDWTAPPDMFSDGDMTPPNMPEGTEGGPGFAGGGGMGSSDVKLQYTDDEEDSYSNIFDSAKTDVSNADKARLIQSLKSLSEGEDLEEILDIDEVLRYFVVHNFTVNGDSYTGSMIHNYYLHESDGKLSMIPWDYNLAFGTFQNSSATDAVNDPIDTPLSVSGDGSRPMADWIFTNEEYTDLYHQYFAEFLDEIDPESLINETYALIAGYVEKDPTAFCSYEEFESGVNTLRSFCEKRTESIRGQLDGTIPTTDEGQENAATLIDASDITLSDMGSMGGGNRGPFNGGTEKESSETEGSDPRGGDGSTENGDAGSGGTGDGSSKSEGSVSRGGDGSTENGDAGSGGTGDGSSKNEGAGPGGTGNGRFGNSGSNRVHPTRPGGEAGTFPQTNDSFSASDQSSQNGSSEAPDQSSENNSFKGPAQFGNARNENGGPSGSFVSSNKFDKDTLIMTGASVLVLAAAIIFAKLYRKQ